MNNNKNGFLIGWISCVSILLLMFFLGISSSAVLKGTQAAMVCSSGTVVGNYCCPSGYTTGSTSSGICYSSAYKAGTSGGYCSYSATAVNKSSYESRGYTCTQTGGGVGAYESYTCNSPAGSTFDCAKSNVGSPYNNDYTGYQCWFCSGTYKFQDGQNGCQYVINLTDVDKNGVIDNYDCSCKNDPSCYAPGVKTVKATFKNGSSNVATRTCEIDGSKTSCSVTAPTAPTKEGYTFKGWGTSSSCTQGSTGSFTLSGDITYYACWATCWQCNSPSDIYSWGSGGSHDNCKSGWHYIDISESECKARANEYNTDDEDKQCWQCNGESNKYFWGVSTSAAPSCGGGWHERTDLSQSQCISDKTYSVTYDANGGSVSKTSDSCKSVNGATCTVTAPTATRSCYSFKGWASSSTATSGKTGTITLDRVSTKYYATWAYICGGGTPSSDPSSNPSNDPSSDPSSNPSNDPSSDPTDKPSSDPSSDPSEDLSGSSDDNGPSGGNPVTGEISIFIVWVIAGAAIVYSIWYFKKIKES